MTKREALAILIQHASANCRGAGTGLRSLPSKAEKGRVMQAIEKIWKDTYSYPMSNKDRYNLGLGLKVEKNDNRGFVLVEGERPK